MNLQSDCDAESGLDVSLDVGLEGGLVASSSRKIATFFATLGEPTVTLSVSVSIQPARCSDLPEQPALNPLIRRTVTKLLMFPADFGIWRPSCNDLIGSSAALATA